MRGYRPLREAIAAYLGASRGARCAADQVVVVSGAQQALDLLARLLVNSGAPVWIEDPGYAGVRPALLEPLLALRFNTDRHPPTLDQAILCAFIEEGHLDRHIRRMRELYRTRLAALREEAAVHLKGLVEIPPIEAGLNTAARLVCGLSSRQAESAAAAHGVEVLAIDRFALE